MFQLDQYFDGLPQRKKSALLAEFLNYEAKPKRVERNAASEEHMVEYEEEVLEPDPLKPEWLAWQTPRHKKLISKMITGKANRWEVMNEVGDQFYHLRKEVREQYKG
ncbi:unnamed protein product [Strongylus vulgaris]|uniref:Uncharacterized protein n=1 Tax=Strongylus vulgaris TaxID=40348 RepID=A0A3P7KT43_STRVU|nr:unnamed protein product [Strongylus vulgaris]